MPNVVTFSLFLGLSISSCAVWVSAWLHQQQSKAASIFRMTSSLSTSWRPARPNAVASQRLPWAVPGDQPAKDARSGFACQGEMHLRDDVIRAANILTGVVSPTTGCCFPAEAN